MAQRKQLTWTELRVGLFVLVGVLIGQHGIERERLIPAGGERRGKLERVQGNGEDRGRLLAIDEKRFGGAAAEIGAGERLGAILSDAAKLMGGRLLAVAQDDDARGRGGGRECSQAHSGRKDQSDQHDDFALLDRPVGGYQRRAASPRRATIASRSLMVPKVHDAACDAIRCACELRTSPSSNTFK